MYAINGNAQRARWAVMWVYRKRGGAVAVARKDFKDDYASAEKLYLQAREAGKKYATLACVNMGFPPPEELRTHTVLKKGRIKGTRKIKIVRVTVDPLKELNHQGQLWCPYCRQLRPFTMQKVSKVNQVRFTDPKYVCPICKTSHRDHNIRYWNPTAAIHMDASVASIPRTRSPTKSTRRRRRRRA